MTLRSGWQDATVLWSLLRSSLVKAWCSFLQPQACRFVSQRTVSSRRKGVLENVSVTLKWLRMESWGYRLSWSQAALAVSLRLYSFPSALPNSFFTSVSHRGCSSPWHGPWQAFTCPPLHPHKVKSVLFQAYSNRQQWPGFIPFVVFPGQTWLSHNSCCTFQAPWFLLMSFLSHPSAEADFLCFCDAVVMLL